MIDKYSSYIDEYGDYSITSEDTSFAVETFELGKYRIWGFHGRGEDPKYELQILEEGSDLPDRLEERMSVDIAKLLLDEKCGVYRGN